MKENTVSVGAVLNPSGYIKEPKIVIEGYKKRITHVYETRVASHSILLEYESIEGDSSGILTMATFNAYANKEQDVTVKARISREQLANIVACLTKALEEKDVDKMAETL